jgi:predicted negative regulator of RcsB-dependent stress response
VPDHISRKELKQDKLRESFEHGAEAVYSHSATVAIALGVVLVAALAYGGWRVYTDRQNVQASAALSEAMRAYNGRILGSGEAGDTGELTYSDTDARSKDAARKFEAAADKFPNTNSGRLARYYGALSLEDLGRSNEALEQLKKLSSAGDKELTPMSQYQMATIYARTGKTDEAAKMYHTLADQNSVFVPRPLVLLDLATMLSGRNPQEASSIYQQIKKEFPNTAVAEQADRGLNLILPKS